MDMAKLRNEFLAANPAAEIITFPAAGGAFVLYLLSFHYLRVRESNQSKQPPRKLSTCSFLFFHPRLFGSRRHLRHQLLVNPHASLTAAHRKPHDLPPVRMFQAPSSMALLFVLRSQRNAGSFGPTPTAYRTSRCVFLLKQDLLTPLFFILSVMA